MVKLCYNKYDGEDKEEFKKYPFDLSCFQKYAIDGIIQGDHVLVTAHTGSGKTLPAEFAIEHFVRLGKKVIYTSPIKALSNQKYHEFSLKFPNISFGILTGDIKFAPQADVLIVTTEILLNKLSSNIEINQIIPLNIEKEVGCVIFDEVHYINDKERGKIWEETILLLPNHIQMVMLSATLDKPEKFASWVESKNAEKNVWLIPTNYRVVPLTHYIYTTCNNGAIKLIKDDTLAKETKKRINSLIEIQTPNGQFNESVFFEIKKTVELLDKQKMGKIQPIFVINRCVEYLQQNEILPCIFFVFSKKNIEYYAEKMNVVVLEDDSKVRYMVRRDCEQMLRNKFVNYKEYIELPEYDFLMTLFEKGVGIHHAGLLPVFREMVEILFGKGYIKVLFATETLAVGINFSVKTVIFTEIMKHDGSEYRYLYPHEYNQISGRAGRRNYDKIGHVIHLPNLYKKLEVNEFKTMLQGRPQQLTSKYKLSIQSVLSGENLCEKSMMCQEINKELENIVLKKQIIQRKIDETPKFSDLLNDYHNLENQMQLTKNKNRQKEIRHKMELIKKQKGVNFYIEQQSHQNFLNLLVDLANIEYEYDNISKYNTQIYENMRKLLHDYINTDKGKLTQFFKEVPSLIFAEFIFDKVFDNLTTIQIIQLISCFTQIRIFEQSNAPDNLKFVEIKINYWKDQELKYGLDLGIDYTIHYDLIEPIEQWVITCNDELSCKQFLLQLEKEDKIYNGDFVKAVLKIVNVVEEIINCCEYINDLNIVEKLKPISKLLLKHIVNNQSLYV